ncbi:hypothetical protein OA58_04400 [Microcystis aeruginosa NIES-88]|nr:hypothetical protein OA58_04400 [Microcystis aeruginosa NIES-88]
MKSELNPDFVGLFQQLPERVKRTARKNYKLWKDNRFFVTWYGSIGGHKSTKSLSGKRLN